MVTICNNIFFHVDIANSYTFVECEDESRIETAILLTTYHTRLYTTTNLVSHSNNPGIFVAIDKESQIIAATVRVFTRKIYLQGYDK
jgi:hypothetical protein